MKQVKSYALVLLLKEMRHGVNLKHSDELCSSDFFGDISI